MNRPGISARALALIAALIVLIAASIIADRLGAPWRITTTTMLGLSAAALAFAGVTSRTLRLATFGLAGKRLGWSRGGAMMLVLALGLALLAGAGPLLQAAPAVAAAAGLLIFALAYAGPLHAAGAAGLGGFALARYRSRGLSALVGLTVALIGGGLALLATPQALAALAAIPVLTPAAGRIVLFLLLLVMLLPGGIASLAATAVIAAFLTVAALGLPAAAVLLAGDGEGAEPLAQGLAMLAGARPGAIAGLAVLTAGVLALSGAGPAMRAIGLARQVSAGAALAVLAIAVLALTTFFAVERVGARLGEVPPNRLPALIYAERAQGLVTLCGIAPGEPAALEQACRPRLADGLVPAREIQIHMPASGRWMAAALDLPMSLGALAMIAPVVVLAALVAAALRVAIAGLIDDGLYRLGRFSGTASGRLALHRLVMIAAAAGLAAPGLPALPGTAQGALTLLATLLPAALILPGLSGRADWRTALILTMACLAIAAAALFGLAVPGFSLPGFALPGLSLPGLAGWGAAGLLLLGAAALSLLASRDRADAHAAAVLRGAAPGPLLESDA